MTFPTDWYWFVGGDETRAYSSKTGDYVAASNANFVAWQAFPENVPTRIASEQELGEVLASNSLRPIEANVLDTYKDAQAGRITLEIVVKLLMWLINEVRALKGQQALTANQLRNFVKGLM